MVVNDKILFTLREDKPHVVRRGVNRHWRCINLSFQQKVDTAKYNHVK